MTTKPKFNLNYTEGTYDPSTTSLNYVGAIMEPRINNPDYSLGQIAGAVFQDNISYRLGIKSAFLVDDMVRALDPNDRLHRVDPSFNAFDVFKKNQHTEDEFDSIIEMENWEQYHRYMEVRNFRQETQDKIQAGGLPASAAALAVNLAADPTLYAGFGFTRMVSAGISRAKAAAVAGGLSGAAYETLEQFSDDERKAIDSATNIFWSAALAGAMGKAIDSFYTLNNKGLLQYAKKGTAPEQPELRSDWDAAAQVYKADAELLADRSVGAQQVLLNEAQNSREISGFAARMTGKAFKVFSPKLWFQTSDNQAIQEFGEKFFGLSARTKAQEAGVAASDNVAASVERIEVARDNFAADLRSRLYSITRETGVVHDEAAQRSAVLLAHNPRFPDLDDPVLARTVRKDILESAKAQRKFYRELENRALRAGVDQDQFRQLYGTPIIIDKNRVARDIDGWKTKILKRLQKDASMARGRLARIQQKMNDLEAEIKTLKGIEKTKSQQKLRMLSEESENLRWMKDAAPDELNDAAVVIARRHSVGDFKSTINLKGRKIYPKFFNKRFSNVEDVADFVVVDPYKLASSYIQDVKGTIALKEIFDVFDIQDVIEQLKTSSDNLGLKPDQLEEAAEKIKFGWEQITGEYYAKAPGYMGGGAMADYLNAFSDVTRITKLDMQVLASLTEPISIGLHHGLKGVGRYAQVVKEMSADPAFRNMPKSTARAAGAGLEFIRNRILAENMVEEFGQKSISGGVSKYTSKAARMFQVANGMVFFDDINRTITSIAQDGLIADGINRLLSGKRISKDEIADLAFLGIDKKNALAIQKMQQKFGETTQGGLFISNIDDWTDFRARDIYQSALIRDLRRTAVTPELGDTPFWSKTPLGRMVFMFRGWGIAATQKYMISSMQRSHAGTWMTVAGMVGLGTMIEMLKRKAEGRDGEEDFDADELIVAGINRAGVLGAIPDFGGNLIAAKLFDINTGVGRIADFTSVPEYFLGAPGGVANDIFNLAKFPLEEVDRYNEGKAQRGIESIYDDALELTPLPFVKDWLVYEARQLQDDN